MMDRRVTRFIYCEPNMYPYIEEVFVRLPEGIREDILSDKGFQIAAKENIGEIYILRYCFDIPVKYLVCLDTKILNKPKYEIIHTIAHELAGYAANEGKSDLDEKKTEQLLINWGFQKEIEAVRHEHTFAESENYRIGYGWAKKQNKDYLLQHFGLYFEEWNERGLGKTWKERSEKMYDLPESSSPLADKKRSESHKYHDLYKKRVEEIHAMDEEMFAGIMTAMKELELRV